MLTTARACTGLLRGFGRGPGAAGRVSGCAAGAVRRSPMSVLSTREEGARLRPVTPSIGHNARGRGRFGTGPYRAGSFGPGAGEALAVVLLEVDLAQADGLGRHLD